MILLGLLVVGVSIAWTYKRPGRAPAPSAGASAEAPAAPVGTLPEGASRTQDLVLENFKEGASGWKLRAGEMVGKEGEEWRLRQVNLVFTYTAKGEKHQGTIVADEAVLTPTVEKGVFQGHVKLTTDDGAELATEQLIYRGDKKLAKSELPTAFKRGNLSGTSKGFEYQSEEGRLDLQAEVVIHVTPEGRPPLDIKSASARLIRGEEQGTMRVRGRRAGRPGAGSPDHRPLRAGLRGRQRHLPRARDRERGPPGIGRGDARWRPPGGPGT